MNQGLQSALRVAKDKVEADMDKFLSIPRQNRDSIFEYWPRFIKYLDNEGYELREKGHGKDNKRQ